jgi:protoporphyrin/coproporphyrin ferrochelatase
MSERNKENTPPPDHQPVTVPRVGLLLVNLGTPSSLSAADIRRFLLEFLSDPRVIDFSPWLWQPILRAVILNVRSARTRKAYAAIWRHESDESPLRYYTRQQADRLRQRFRHAVNLDVDWAMNYGEPSIRERLERLVANGCQRIVVLPLYPQYSATTTASVCDRAFAALATMKRQPAIRTLDTWHDDPCYIDACAAHLTQELDKLAIQPEILVLSFHGLPQRYLTEGDPYHCFCLKSARLIEAALNRPRLRVITTFQSRFGPAQWLEPYTDTTVMQLAREGTRQLAVFSPCFVADCIETLEELGLRLKHSFIDAGGQGFALIPCLNDSDRAIDLLEHLARRELSGWITDNGSEELQDKDGRESEQRPHADDIGRGRQENSRGGSRVGTGPTQGEGNQHT